MPVEFDVVQIWFNDCFQPYTLSPTRDDSVKVYAIRVDGVYFLLGEQNHGVHICDLEK